MEVKKDRRGRQTRGTNYITGGIFFNFLLLQPAERSSFACFASWGRKSRKTKLGVSWLQAQELVAF